MSQMGHFDLSRQHKNNSIYSNLQIYSRKYSNIVVFMSIRSRIISYLDLKGITRYKFYKTTGLSNGFLDKEGSINSDNCEKICYTYPDLNPEWLITGQGEMLRSLNDAPVDAVAGKLPEKADFDVMLNKIIELTAENTRLEMEIKNIKKRNRVLHVPHTEDDVVDGLAANPANSDK